MNQTFSLSASISVFALVMSTLIASPTLADGAPGNVHVLGDDVVVSLPGLWRGWRVIDIDGRELAAGSGGTQADLGKLPIGYFEILERDGPGKVTAGVVGRVESAEDTPIALDTAMAWFYSDPAQLRDACTLCRLAGVTWVRDRLSWPELETMRGELSPEGRYERAMQIAHEAGLKVLQVNHASPTWASSNPSRFAGDLRDVYNFYRHLAIRWRDLADAIEPWNEPDIELFGGHTGCEIASFQKAAYLGLKAGDPDKPVCGVCFAIDRAETLNEFAANEAYPYFDRYDLHHYIRLPDYARAYERHRATSGGRPMWTTEFNLPVHWADEATKEPSEEELRVQAYRVAKVFAQVLHEGSQKAFYFILGHYVERNLQYGLVHQDLTPRPAYLAFAATGRLLNGAKPLGRVDLGDELLKGYLFRTMVDGVERDTLVAWSETKPSPIDDQSADKVYDYLGREIAERDRVELTRSPVFLIGDRGCFDTLQIEPPPATLAWRQAMACPVVLQLAGNADFKQSAFNVSESRELRLSAYNFSDTPARGVLEIEGGACDVPEFMIEPGETTDRTIVADSAAMLRIQLDLEGMGRASVAARLTSKPTPGDSAH